MSGKKVTEKLEICVKKQHIISKEIYQTIFQLKLTNRL